MSFLEQSLSLTQHFVTFLRKGNRRFAANDLLTIALEYGSLLEKDFSLPSDFNGPLKDFLKKYDEIQPEIEDVRQKAKKLCGKTFNFFCENYEIELEMMKSYSDCFTLFLSLDYFSS